LFRPRRSRTLAADASAVPGASTRLLPWLGQWMTANNRWIQVALGFGFGAWLVAKGVNAL
jgi:hypothetical protein